MDTSSEKTNNNGAAQPAAQEKQVPHTAAAAEQTPDDPMEVGLHQVEHQVQVLERRQLAWGEEGGGRAAR